MLNLCGSRIGRRAAIGPPPLSLDAAPPGTLDVVGERRTEPAPSFARRGAGRTWAALLLTLAPAYRSAIVLRHVDGLSYPEMARALNRPEGTVKAQVHRGLAMLRAAYEAIDRNDREEMTS